MALGNADVKEPGRKLGRKLVKSRAVLHGGGNGADGLVACGHPAKLLSKISEKVGTDTVSLRPVSGSNFPIPWNSCGVFPPAHNRAPSS